MRLIFVNMQQNYVNMRVNDADMQHNYVNMPDMVTCNINYMLHVYT